MRLGQLSRKLQIESKQIVKLLESKGFDIDQSPNTKLDDEMLNLVDQEFLVEKDPLDVPEEVVVDDINVEEVVVDEIKQVETSKEVEVNTETESSSDSEEISAPADLVEDESAIEVDELKEGGASEDEGQSVLPEGQVDDEALGAESDELDPDNEYSFVEDNGVIRAPKVTLEGIKVLGKIDLPEVEKKNLSTTKNEDSDNSQDNEGTLSTDSDEGPKVHPNKKGRLDGVKPKVLSKKEVEKISVEKGSEKKKALSKEELKAQKKKQRQKRAKQKAKTIKKQGLPEAEQKKNKSPEPAPKRSFWKKLFGLK